MSVWLTIHAELAEWFDDCDIMALPRRRRSQDLSENHESHHSVRAKYFA
jgi:hypothetical protein